MFWPPERWSKVPDFAGHFVSSLGRLVNTRGEYSLGQPNSKGYLRRLIRRGGKLHRFLVHRLVVEAFVGPIPAGKQINHIDGVKANNACWNLEVCTGQENMEHAYRTGLRIGISAERVSEIRRRVLAGETIRSLALEFGIGKSTVHDAATGKTWGGKRAPS